MDPALEHVQQARRSIAELDTPAVPSASSPSRARDLNSGLNEDQQYAVDRCTAHNPRLWTCHAIYLCALQQNTCLNRTEEACLLSIHINLLESPAWHYLATNAHAPSATPFTQLDMPFT